MSLTDNIASKYLGKKVEGFDQYNPSLLVAIPRSENRLQYDIKNNSLPFSGWDVWHAYEYSCMTESGIPVTRVLKLKYSCESEFLVESKSLKLYLNSFNMSKFGKNIDKCLIICKTKIENDLSNVLKTDVQTEFLDNNAKTTHIYENFQNIMHYTDEEILSSNIYKEAPELLQTEELSAEKEYYLTFDSLRSNCRVTHQPDFGDVFIYYKSSKHIKEDSLVKYLISFRSEYHFHEECCEMIFKRLIDILNENDKLFVSALYTRRGGIDISPVRSNCGLDLAKDLLDLSKFSRYGIKQ